MSGGKKAKKRGLARWLLTRLLLLAVLAGAALWWRYTRDLAALERRRDDLRAELARARAADPLVARAPAADVLIGMPAAFTTGLVRQLTQALVGQVRIALRDLEIRKEGTVAAKTFLGTIRPGRYRVDLALHEANALLKPGAARVDFRGERLGVTVPVTVAEGGGRATVRFDWDSRGLGSVVCEDFKMKEAVTAKVVPRTYEVKGAFALSVDDGALVAKPDFRGLSVRVGVEPTEQTWKAIEKAIEQRSWKCEAVIRKVNVPKLLGERLEEGFEVKIPQKIFKPVRLPAAVQQSLVIEGRTVALGVRLIDLRFTPEILWYGADLHVGGEEKPVTAPASGPSPPGFERLAPR
jgi:hypothetical protein